jgi:hypothetical protein
MVMAEKLTNEWLSRLQNDYPNEPSALYQSVVRWLLGESPERFETFSADELRVAQQAIEYRYRILQQRYWDVSSEVGYRYLIKRLSSLFLIRNKVKPGLPSVETVDVQSWM